MAELVAKQLQLNRIIERSLDNFKKIGQLNLNPAKIRSRIAALKDTWNQMLNGHAALVRAVPETSQSAMDYFQKNMIDEASDIYQTTLDYMTEALEELDPPVSLNSTHAAEVTRMNSSGFSLTHLPHIRLPPFDGKFEEWELFRDRFTSLIIKNKDLDEFAKMHFLVSCLKGNALDSLANIEVTAENFNVAWSTLTSRFENKRRLLNLHLSTILNLPVLPRESAVDLRTLRDRINSAIASLKNMQRSRKDLWSDVLVYAIVQKLDSATRKAWNVKTGDSIEPPSFEDLSSFIDSRTRALEDFAAISTTKPTPVKPPSATKINSATASSAKSENSSSCPICKAKHYFSLCPSFANGNSLQRRDLAKQHHRYFNCLSQKHSANECKSKYSCRKCNQRHHTLLHASSDVEEHASTASAPSDQPPQTLELQSEVNSFIASAPPKVHVNVLLATAWITVTVASGRAAVVRALVDPGSEMTFITERLAQLLRAKRIRRSISVTGIGGVLAGTYSMALRIEVSPRHSFTPSRTTTASILNKLTAYTPGRKVEFSSWPHLASLPWADPNPCSMQQIDILLGADIYNDIILEGLRKGMKGEPIAQNTIFGWIISGPTRSRSPREHSKGPSVQQSDGSISVHHSMSIPALDETLKRFWELEEVPRKPALTIADERCEEHFRNTHSRSSDGRYIVRLPFKSGPPIEIGNSRWRAEKTLDSLWRRFHSKPQQAAEYLEFLTEYELLGHMRKATTSSELNEQYVYIPHHPVLRDDSTTTHLRVVFNASSLTSNGSSLNDHLLAGPKLQLELPAIILKWRQFQYVYVADIAKMFRQIQLDPRDLDYQRILWKTQSNKAATEFQLLTVTYGMACAPFLALRVIQQLASDEGSSFPLAASILRENIYVDDVLFGGEDIELLRQTRDQLVSLLRRGGFDLRKWASNSPLLLSDIDSTNHGLACNKFLSEDEKLKILGIAWNPVSDEFQITVSLMERNPKSKRSILSTIARIYDPLGWITPVTIAAKIFMQRLWKEKLEWDEILPETLLKHWRLIYSKLSCLNAVKIARWTGLKSDVHRVELHGFADASNVAYSAVIYLKVISRSGNVTITLLAGKSKVAPLKPLSVPRLELSAAVLLARLLEFVRGACRLENFPCYCWTDSTVVLAWLSQHPSQWKTFVSHRVADVQTRLPQVTWRHVPTDHNPADCASRGLLGDEIIVHSLWWQGPSWLKKSEDEWPQAKSNFSTDATPEKKVSSLLCNFPRENFDLATRYSSWPKLIRVTAYIFRFINLCRQAKNRPRVTFGSPALEADNCNRAKLLWIKYIQAETFPLEIHALSKNHELPAKSKIISLRPFLDQDGIIRVGGRLRRAPIHYTTRHPILLEAHPLVTLIIDQAHQRCLHGGLQLTLSTLRANYWILRSRTLTRARIHYCVVCTRERAAIPSQLMGDLPAARVTATTRSFIHCGVDYAGPVQVRVAKGRGIKARKAYIALFVCLSTRAIHLELVGDYSTPAFLNAYVRFCSRRGLPHAIYSDNGTTFVGAERELAIAYKAALNDTDFQNKTATDNVTWHFIPPGAPHFGGLWEAGIKSLKYHLRRVLGKHTLTIEEFTTLLCKIEACLNSRPIAPLTDSLRVTS